MIAHAGGFLGELSDRPFDEPVTNAGEDYPEEFMRPTVEDQRDPNEPTLPGAQPEQTGQRLQMRDLRHGRNAA
jgi:hypothetical protein